MGSEVSTLLNFLPKPSRTISMAPTEYLLHINSRPKMSEMLWKDDTSMRTFLISSMADALSLLRPTKRPVRPWIQIPTTLDDSPCYTTQSVGKCSRLMLITQGGRLAYCSRGKLLLMIPGPTETSMPATTSLFRSLIHSRLVNLSGNSDHPGQGWEVC